MAADQLNKRSKVRNVIRHTSWEQQKAKKKKVSHHDLIMRSSISLEWDAKKELVVPKKEQISIARRELTPYLSVIPQCQNALGDVFAAPSELFELDNLTGLLSYEVWQTHLSVQEREFLTQFLPEGADPHKIVHELLGGNKFYFGNPFPKWGASVCSGDCHPDAVLRQEQCNKASKVAYYSELHKYHTKMIGSLQLWKERWASCVNPENDFVQKILGPRKDVYKNGSSHENGLQYGREDDPGATSDSCSWDADDKSYSSDSPKFENKNGETIMRVSRMNTENKYYTRPRKGDKLHKLNIECGDGAKYMSYIKVSKEQHERVKSSMKHSNMSIQPRSLNHVLGNLDSFCVQPYEVFEQEERQKLHDHWLHLAKKDLPVGFANWRSLQSAKLELTKCLRKEMEDKRNLYNHDEENEESQILIRDANLENGLVAATKDEEQQQLVGNEQHVDAETDVLPIAEETVERNDESVFQSEPDFNAADEIEMDDESSEDSARNHHLPPIAIHNGNQNFCPITNDDVLTEPDPFDEYTENISQPIAPVSQHYPLPSAASELWPTSSLPSSYYHQPPPVTHSYTSIGELSLRQRRSDGGDSFFYPYANQDRNELLLHSLYKDPASSYLHEQKLSRLGFHPTGGGDPIPGPGQFPRNLCSNIQENIFSDEVGRFSIPIPIPRQEHLLPLHDWPGNGMPASSHQNWFPDDEVVPVRDGWSGNHDIGNSCVTGGQVADESLFSVLSQCNGLRSNEQFIQSGNYIGMGGRPMGRGYNEGQSGWMNLPRVLRDPGGKSFPRSWNANELG